jgi:hypothetical protein
MSYDIGYRKPPRHSQFEKGKSGNPRGRPKGRSNLRPDLEAELAETLRVRVGNGEVEYSKRRYLIKAVLSAALQGNIAAATLIINLCRLAEREASGSEQSLSLDDDELLKKYVAAEIKKREQIVDKRENNDGIE